MKKLFLPIVLALSLGGCAQLTAAYDALTSTSATAQNSAAAAENLYTATVDIMTAYVNSGKATQAQIAVLSKIEATAYAAVLAARQAVANNDGPALAAAEATLKTALTQMQAVTGVTK